MQDLIPVGRQNNRSLMPTPRDLLSVVFRHRLLVLAIFTAVIGISFVVAFLLPDRYEAHTQILVNRTRLDPVVTPEANAQSWPNSEISETEMHSEVRMLMSADLLEEVVEKCNLSNKVPRSGLGGLLLELQSGLSGEEVTNAVKVAWAVKGLASALEVELVPKSRLIDVTYRSDDPALAVHVLDTLTSLYKEKHLRIHRPSGAVPFFETQTERYKEKLQESEDRLEAFGAEGSSSAPEVEKDLVLGKLTEFEASARETESMMASAKQRLRVLEEQIAEIPARATTQVRSSDNPHLFQTVKTRLLELQLRRIELRTKFAADYPLVLEVDRQIEQAEAALADAENNPVREQTTDLDTTYEWLRSELAKTRGDVAALEARAGTTKRAVTDYRNRSRSLNQAGIQRQDLVRSAKTAEEHYLLYVRKLEEARISDALDVNKIVNIAIAEPPTVPMIPSSRSWFLTLVLGFFAAVGSSVALAFLVDYFDPSFRTPEEVEEYLPLPVLVAVPFERASKGSARQLI